MFRQEVLPGEVRVWSETFKTERPEMIESGFMEYFKEGKFFPKPADIRATIALMRGAIVSNFVSVDQEALAMEKSTPEYQALAKEISGKWKRWGGIVTMEGGEAAKHRPTFRSALASEEPASSGGDDLENPID